MVTTLTESKKPGDVIHWEPPKRYSRKVVSVKASVAVDIGTVVHADGSDVDILNAGGDGAAASGVIVGPEGGVAAADTDRTAVIIEDQSILVKDQLDFGSGTEADAIAALLALGIKLKSSINA